MIRIVAAGLLCIALLAHPASAQSGANIIAGQTAGGVRVGGTITDAIGILGSVYDRSDREKYSVIDWPLKPFLLIAEKESSKIVLVLIQLSDAYKTDKGGVTGGTDREVAEAMYGSEFTTDEDQRTFTLIYDPQGIAFDIGKTGVMRGRVMSIIVFLPGQWKAITDNL